MAIDLPPSLSGPLPAKLQLQIMEQLENNRPVLAKLLGQTIQATVIRSEALRAAALSNTVSGGLVKQLSVDSASPKQAGQTSVADKAQAQSTLSRSVDAQLIQQQIKQEQFAVLLRIGSSQIRVKSDAALTVGSQLQLKVLSNGQLQIQPPALEAKSKPAADSQTVLNNALREVLPRQQVISLLLKTILTLPDTSTKNLPDNVKQAITQLLASLPRANNLSSTAALQQAISNSGLFREAKFAQLLQEKTSSAPAGSPGITNKTLNAAQTSVLQQIQKLLNSGAGKSTLPTSTGTTNNGIKVNSGSIGTDSKIADLKNLDFKTNTARLANALLQSLFPSQSTDNPWQLLQTLKGSTEQDIGQQLKRLANMIRANIQANNSMSNAATSASKEQQLQALQRVLLQHSLATLARVQLNQLNSLPAAQAQTADNPAVHQWILEIPVLNGETIDTFALEISEEKANSEQAEKKERLWKVMISFELDNLGPLHVQLSLLNGKVSATLWAEQQNTLQYIQDEIDILRDALLATGASVEQLDCKLGCPPNRRTRLEQQLIDVHL